MNIHYFKMLMCSVFKNANYKRTVMIIVGNVERGDI